MRAFRTRAGRLYESLRDSPDVEWTVAGQTNETAKVASEHVLNVSVGVWSY